MVRIAAESEPASGSVIAIAAHLPAKRSFCSSSATAAIAELPRPWRGIVSSRPTSPQHISMIERTDAMFEPLRLPPSPFVSAWLTPAAPAPLEPPPSSSPSISAASMSSSFGYSCSARSYLREIGRRTSSATWCGLLDERLELLRDLEVDASDEQRPLHHAGGAQVAVPALDRVLLDVAVAAEQVDGVGADLRCPWRAQSWRAIAVSRAKSLPWSARLAAR